jgi:hypothetical protein
MLKLVFTTLALSEPVNSLLVASFTRDENSGLLLITTRTVFSRPLQVTQETTLYPVLRLKVIIFLIFPVMIQLILCKYLGFLLQWTSSGTTYNYMMEGLMGQYGIRPTTFQITSTENTQSAQWVGRQGSIEISKVVQFKNTDAFFTTAVTIKNIGTTAVTNFYCKCPSYLSPRPSYFFFFCYYYYHHYFVGILQTCELWTLTRNNPTTATT